MAGSEGASGRRSPLALVGRALVAVGFTGLVALFVRLRGTGGTPSHRGGWRQLSVQDLAAPPPEGRAAEPTGA